MAGSIIPLPPALAQIWPGSGGSGSPAALKLQVPWDMCSGTLWGPLLQEGRCHDSLDCWQEAPLPPGSLWLADLGYFSLAGWQGLAQEGNFFLSRLRAGTVVFDQEGEVLDLVKHLPAQGTLDQWVQLGKAYRLPVRLLAVAVPPEVAQERRRRLKAAARKRGQPVSQQALALAPWTLLVTNLPQERLSLEEALVLLRVRWQIELLFKLWKQHGHLDQWRSENPWRILCEVYAKLIGLVIQHWLLLIGCWAKAERSLVKGSQTVGGYALFLAYALRGLVALTWVLEQLGQCLAAGCRMNRRRKKPDTYQLLLNPTGGLA